MKKTELNRIIRKKISELDESESMKDFILDILEKERGNLEYSKPRYMEDYITLATDYSKKEISG